MLYARPAISVPDIVATGILVCQRRASSLLVFAVECSANYTYSRVAHASESYSYLIDRAARCDPLNFVCSGLANTTSQWHAIAAEHDGGR